MSPHRKAGRTYSRRSILQASAAGACSLLTASLTPAFAEAPQEIAPSIFVAVQGKDTNPGTSELPLRTIQAARDLARKAPRNRLPRVVLREGHYDLQGGLELTEEDSGHAGQPMIFAAAQGERVLLTNARRIPATDFRPVTDPATLQRIQPALRDKILELDLRPLALQHASSYPNLFTDNGGLFELFVDDRRMPVSQYPNVGFMQIKRVLVNGGGMETAGNWKTFYDAGAKDSHKPLPSVFEYRDERTACWKAQLSRGVWLQGYWRVPWENPTVRVAAIDPETRTITLAAPVTGGIGNKYMRPEGSGQENYRLINLLEEVDTPGEWAVDFQDQKLFFYAPSSLEKADIRIADHTAPVVSLRNASFVELHHLNVTCALGDGISIDGGQNNRILGCSVRNVTEYGIRIANGRDHEAISNDVYATGAGGIWLGGGDELSTPRKPASYRVVNNHVHHFGEIQKVYAPGINAGFTGGGGGGHHVAVGMYIAHNLIHDGPHAGVLHGSWDHVMEYNEVFRVCKISNDMGYFYCLDNYARSGNRTLRYNFMHNSPLADGIYFDGDNRDDRVYQNLIHVGACGFLYKRAQGPDNPLHLMCWNNIAMQCAAGYRFVMRHGSEVRDNVAVECRTPFIFAKGQDGKGPAAEGDCSSGKNLAYASDPGFVNAAASDFTLRPVNAIQRDLPAFQAIPTAQAGLYVDEFRTQLPSDVAIDRFTNPDETYASAYVIRDRV